tara:strand:- start:1006 stop:2118 length:1113 start_codon:yes stop_codon:yes gene_type:complete
MTDEIKGAVAEALKENSSGSNISPRAFANRRIKQSQEIAAQQAEPEIKEQVEEEQSEEPVAITTESTAGQTAEETQEVVEETEETEEDSNTEDVLSQYNLDEMSEEDIKDLGKQLGSKAVLRFGELTARRKQAEEKLAQLESKLSEKKNDILNQKKPVENNPYSNLDTTEALQKKAQEVNDIISWSEETLFEADGYSAEDYITEVEGKEITKAEVRKSLLQARKARDTFLPDQLNKLQAKENGKQLKEAFDKQAREELTWMSGEDNDVRKQYESMLGDKRFVDLQTKVEPDVAAQLPYIIAHAANSIYGRRLIKESPKVSITPPKTGATSAPKTSRTTKGQKALADLNSRFQTTGDQKDFIKLRTKQLTR